MERAIRVNSTPLIVLSVHCSAVELHVGFDHLVHSGEKVLLCSNFTALPHSEHSCFCCDTPQLGTRAVRPQTRDQLPADVALDAHALCVNAQNVGAALHVGQ